MVLRINKKAIFGIIIFLIIVESVVAPDYHLNGVSITEDDADNSVTIGSAESFIVTVEITRDNKGAEADIYITDGTNTIDEDCLDANDNFYIYDYAAGVRDGSCGDGAGVCGDMAGTPYCLCDDNGDTGSGTVTFNLKSCAGASAGDYTITGDVICYDVCADFPVTMGNAITLVAGGGDTCSCPGIDTSWEIDLSDTCEITDVCNIGNGNITFINAGAGNYVLFNTTITACTITTLANMDGRLGSSANIRQGGSC